ncbi:4'-phosphopantetheinyl transferase [Nonlabens dokdonensis]|jgi:4'-phosphopantetheinyl transferase|uniref:4'-phosphopantetheinyl transferase n=2 Tax=Nonlabens dokdonensis TaxID=328515 RepID=L7W542_NONDD|nr:4'-phosphopantetheinyl transferase superfamily protein [Nonlabens dokdonensis]AGC75272.1 4'-phosphopantetheinyl transferase [Nonlabens dokdonensis DSW-6]PZX38991.1 4'-phosphopantetheinyl transferase [Nonlabens dokdonensis]
MLKLSQTILFKDFNKYSKKSFFSSDIIVLKASYKNPFESENWDTLINLLSADLKDEVEKYVKWEDQHNTLIGKLLVYIAYNIVKSEELKFEDYRRDKNNKPFLQDSTFNFNISHSDKTILCVISKSNVQIGIDIEKIKNLDVKGFKNVLHYDEFNKIMQTNDIDLFYKYWTRKEAYTKAIGNGITIPLDSINTTKNMIYEGEHNYYLKSYKINKYYCSLAYTKKGSKINWIEIKF